MTAYITWLIDGLRYLIRLTRQAPPRHVPAIIDGLGGMVELLERYQREHAPITPDQLGRYQELRLALCHAIDEAGYKHDGRFVAYNDRLIALGECWKKQIISDGL